jgi:hypothetical protein
VVDLATGRIIVAAVRVTIAMRVLAMSTDRKIENIKLVDSMLVRLERNPG